MVKLYLKLKSYIHGNKPISWQIKKAIQKELTVYTFKNGVAQKSNRKCGYFFGNTMWPLKATIV